jgi:preprotein translocase subunit YajC
MAMIVRALFIVGMLVVSAIVTMVLVEIVYRRRARLVIDGHLPGLKPGDKVLTAFGIEATVVTIEGHLVALRYGSGERERTIFAERETLNRTTEDG